MKQIFCSTVSSVGMYVPEKIVTNEDLTKLMDTSDEWIEERTGIKERRFVESGVATSDLGHKAAIDALNKSRIKSQDLDLIIATTLSPDFYFPGIGVLIQNKLSCDAPAIDLRGQCSGFTWAMTTADSFIRSGQYKKILIVGAEIQSRVIEFSNRGRNVSVLFGDGAGAMVLQSREVEHLPTATNNERGIIDNLMGSDGSGAEILAIKRPGMSGEDEFITTEETSEKAYLPIMDGRQVFKNAVRRLFESATTILERNKLKASDIDVVIPHQANLRINSAVAEKLGIEKHKVMHNIQKYGNTTSASLPICMSEACDEGKVKKGMLVLTLAFGSGFSWGANLIRW
ncbi:MAG: 3-oxoacyl-ACP synthase [Zetaproteobacteria bacterium]|nr:3-oxoacyl-ACP synthase [Pseudobdellovibrionaceae bacterium]|tara:strand:+ start:391 stop:1419 length:1029 start_codon:yes stop_codon:yes gene_type:complete